MPAVPKQVSGQTSCMLLPKMPFMYEHKLTLSAEHDSGSVNSKAVIRNVNDLQTHLL